MKALHSIPILIALIVVAGYAEYRTGTNEITEIHTSNSDNLLINPSFELSPSSDINWLHEYNTSDIPAYFISSMGATNGSTALQIMYHGQARDNKSKIEVFQEPFAIAVAGKTLKFTMDICGTLIKTSAIIGIEGFDYSGNWINESDAYITDISETPNRYVVTYNCPNNTASVAAYLQCQEINPNSVISISMDNAQLTYLSEGYAKPTESIWGKYTSLLILIVMILIPIVVLMSEIIVCVRNNLQNYTFAGKQNDNYQILVPIWGNIKYLENIDYLSNYGTHVTICTTGDESDEFYFELKSLAAENGFNVFIDKAKPDPAGKSKISYNKRTTSGCKRDTIIQNALKIISTYYVVTLDGDSTTERDISYLVGELEFRNLDIASVRIVPNNGSETILTRLQKFEYRTAMNFRYHCPWLISGACHTAKTSALRDIMNRHSLFFQGNDVEIGLLSQILGYKIGHIPFVVLTSIPTNIIDWSRQRIAWAGGEFRIFIINFKFISSHPYYWIYGAFITICMFPLRWIALFTRTTELYIILGIYTVLILYLHWENRNRWLILMPIYTLFNSLIVVPLGIIWYFYIAHRDKNYGIINNKYSNCGWPPNPK